MATTSAVVAVWFAWTAGGVGATAVVLAAGSATWSFRRSYGVACAAVAAVAVLWCGTSFVRYVAADNGETTSARAATWARDHGFGDVVDRMEAWVYDEPPSAAPAAGLSVASVPSTAAPSPVTTSTTMPVPAPGGESSTTVSTNSSTTTSARSEDADPATASGPPSALAPVVAPALAGEGQWRAVSQAGGTDAIWVTGIRPLPAVGGVVATVVAVDQTHLRAALFNGSELPGGTWRRGDRVPQELWPAWRGAMNGGFRFEHIRGGYVTEGRTVRPLADGDATLAIDRDGRVMVGQYGRDLTDDGTWVSLRQNLRLMVDDGRSMVLDASTRGVWWGADHGRQVYVSRSGLCELRDGLLAYVLAAPVDAQQFADVMVAVGCRTGMQLDINGTWPAFDVYAVRDGALAATRLDDRMSPNERRYATGSTKEFVAFFDAGQVAAGSVLDG